MSSISGSRAWPFAVSEYSTRGGTSGKVLRTRMPSSSSARKRSERVRGLMPLSERSSSQKRERPSARSRMIRIVHLPQIRSAVAQTGQVSKLSEAIRIPLNDSSGITSRTEVMERRLSAAKVRQETAQTAAALVAAGDARFDAALARLNEHPAVALEAELDGLAGATAGKRLEVHVCLHLSAHAARPDDGGLGVGERRRGARLKQHRRPVRHHRDLAGALQGHVEEPAREHP